MSFTRRLIWWTIIVLILSGVLAFVLVHRANHRLLHVTTNASSLKFELDDQTYTVNKSLDISLKPGVYKYRTIDVVDAKRVVLTDTVDLTKKKSVDLDLNFSIYNNQSLQGAICKTLADGGDGCPVKFTITSINFAENYQWAVVQINSPGIGGATAVLQIDNGAWKVVAGPGTDITTGGYFPQSVERIIENE
jgi:hypothetical protein